MANEIVWLVLLGGSVAAFVVLTTWILSEDPGHAGEASPLTCLICDFARCGRPATNVYNTHPSGSVLFYCDAHAHQVQ